VLVPLGIWLVTRYIVLRHRAERTSPSTGPKP
jgi:hypothetical protein